MRSPSISRLSTVGRWRCGGLRAYSGFPGSAFGGSFVAARLTGLGWRDASALGVLMNTRGLAELIVLNIGLQLRVINPRVFAMLVVMSLVTTLATSPIIYLIRRDEVAAARSQRNLSRLAWLGQELHKHVDLHRHWRRESREQQAEPLPQGRIP